MASNDEYQQQQFFDQGEGWMDLMRSVVVNRMNQELEKQFSESHDNLMRYMRWVKTGEEPEFKTK